MRQIRIVLLLLIPLVLFGVLGCETFKALLASPEGPPALEAGVSLLESVVTFFVPWAGPIIGALRLLIPKGEPA